MTISFITLGHIDLDTAFTFGMSGKINDNPIGFFGTGLKFAIATLLRTGHEVKIICAGNEHEFTVETKEYRGKNFCTVMMDGKSLGFTTELGKLWEIWMAFRELHSNTLDENGTTTDKKIELSTEDPNTTIIQIEGSGMEQAYIKRNDIFCSSPILAKNSTIEIRDGSKNNIFYRGVRALDMRKGGMFTYNILEAQTLTKDRNLKYDWSANNAIMRGISELEDIDLLRTILTCAPDNSYEANIDFEGATPSSAFLSVCRESYKSQFLNKSARKLSERLMVFDDGGEHTLDKIQKAQLEKATDFLVKIGFDVTRYPIIVKELFGPHAMARNGTIYLSPQCFREGTKYLAGAIYEEFLHLSEGVLDETREMQTMLFRTIMTMGEKLLGEPI